MGFWRIGSVVVTLWILQSALLVEVTGLSVTKFVSSSNNAHPQLPRFIFLHGRLEAEDGNNPFPPPCELYRDFCQSLADRVDCSSLLMVEYDDLLARDIRSEPRSLRKWGPITSSIVESLEDSLCDDKEEKAILVSFSMGAAMALKILARQEHPIAQSISHVVFVEPVWRCWSSWAERHDTCDIPSLAFVGTNDEETGTDSGGSVKSSLGALLPNLEVEQLEGANHWAILNESIELSKDRLDPFLTPRQVQMKIVDRIAKFCQLCLW